MKTFSITHPVAGFITYQDKKRYLWLLSIVMPAVPLMGMFIYLQTGLEWTLGLPILLIYLVVPFLDSIIGSDNDNPPEEIVPQLEADTYYRYLTFATIPMHIIVLIAAAYLVGSNDLSWWAVAVVAIVAGGYSGFSINTAHELGHKQSSI
jgi:alkane 1-monooxygenase